MSMSVSAKSSALISVWPESSTFNHLVRASTFRTERRSGTHKASGKGTLRQSSAPDPSSCKVMDPRTSSDAISCSFEDSDCSGCGFGDASASSATGVRFDSASTASTSITSSVSGVAGDGALRLLFLAFFELRTPVNAKGRPSSASPNAAASSLDALPMISASTDTPSVTGGSVSLGEAEVPGGSSSAGGGSSLAGGSSVAAGAGGSTTACGSPMRRSSTSNVKSAPGGIRPSTPCSPYAMSAGTVSLACSPTAIVDSKTSRPSIDWSLPNTNSYA
mmetsp:Transcript_8308/g.18574  ORF Transcript_8308/g.18574 Transcript_8308/m.18574 type:complete len:276 (+) Transcript_8308:292-1119(+)